MHFAQKLCWHTQVYPFVEWRRYWVQEMLWTQRALRRSMDQVRSIVCVIHGTALGLAIAVKINKGQELKPRKPLEYTSCGSSSKPSVSLSCRAAFRDLRRRLSFSNCSCAGLKSWPWWFRKVTRSFIFHLSSLIFNFSSFMARAFVGFAGVAGYRAA